MMAEFLSISTLRHPANYLDLDDSNNTAPVNTREFMKGEQILLTHTQCTYMR